VTGRQFRPSAYLMRRVVEVVYSPEWWPGLSWGELAAAVGVPRSQVFTDSVLALRRHGRVDLCRDYVVAVPDQASPHQAGEDHRKEKRP
jgi:hypothetical protein